MKTWFLTRLVVSVLLILGAIVAGAVFGSDGTESEMGIAEAVIGLWEAARTASFVVFTAVMVGIAWAMKPSLREISSQTSRFLQSPWLPHFLFLLCTSIVVAAYTLAPRRR